MKSKLFCLIGVMLFLIQPAAMGQAPGYLGKRHLLGGGIHFIPRDMLDLECLPNWSGKDKCFWGENGKLGFQLTAVLSAEKTVSRVVVLGLSAEAYGTGARGEFLLNGSEIDLETRLLSVGVGFNVKVHPFRLKGSIAPHGSYVNFTFKTSSITEHRLGPGNIFSESNTLGNYVAPALYFGVGHHLFLSESLVLDIGIRTGSGYPIPINENRTRFSPVYFWAMAPEAFKVCVKLLWLK
jgi:hypothetical protein